MAGEDGVVHDPVIPALGRRRQDDQEFKDSLGSSETLSQEKIEMMKSGVVPSPQRKGHREDSLNTRRKHLRKTVTAKQPEKEEQEVSEKGQRRSGEESQGSNKRH